MVTFKRIIPVVWAAILLLFASCSPPPAATPSESEAAPSPLSTAASTPSPFSAPSSGVYPSALDPILPVVSTDMQESGDGADWDELDLIGEVLPASLLDISQADMKTFNPDKIVEYLAACPDVFHESAIIGAERKDGKFYITISDYLYSEFPTSVYRYLKDMFSLSDEEILDLPLFSGFYLEDGWVCSDEGDVISIGEIVFEDMPVAEDARILLLNTDTYDRYKVTAQEFADRVLDGKSVNNDLYIFYFYFEYADDQITGMCQHQEYDPEYEEGEYEEGD